MKIFLGLLLAFLLLFSVSRASLADDASDCRNGDSNACARASQSVNQKIQELESQLKNLIKQEKTLSSQISYMNSQINLTNLRIEESETKLAQLDLDISALSIKIDELNISLSRLSEALLKRIVVTYKRGKVDELELFLSSRSFADLLTQYKYLQVIQTHDKKLLVQMQATKGNYEDQKDALEIKQKEVEKTKKQLEGYKVTLAQQKKDKEYLLEITRNDEKRYQKLLSEALAEQASIRQALASLADRKFDRHVKEGEIIGVQGRTGMATGDHLHFGVYVAPYRWNTDSKNPIDYLHNGTLKWPIESYDDGNCYQNVDGRCVSQLWGVSEISRSLSWYKNNFHDAIDVYARYGAVIRAAAEGDISYGVDGLGGKYAIIKHNNDLITTYWHFQ